MDREIAHIINLNDAYGKPLPYMNPEAVRMTEDGHIDQGAHHRAIAIARDLLRLGHWDGQQIIRIADPYKIFNSLDNYCTVAYEEEYGELVVRRADAPTPIEDIKTLTDVIEEDSPAYLTSAEALEQIAGDSFWESINHHAAQSAMDVSEEDEAWNAIKTTCRKGATAMFGLLPEMQARTVIDFYYDGEDESSGPYEMLLLLAVPFSTFQQEYALLTAQGYRFRSDVGSWDKMTCPHCGSQHGSSPIYQQRLNDEWVGLERSFNICLSCFYVTEWVQRHYPAAQGVA